MERPGKTIFREMVGANNKAAGGTEVCAACGDKSLPLSKKAAAFCGIMQTNSRSRIGSIITALHNTMTTWHTLAEDKFCKRFEPRRKNTG